MKSYLLFQEDSIYGKKTKYCLVLSSVSGITLGEIKWYGAWRKYCFYPEPNCIFSNGCMAEIIDVMQSMQEEWKELKYAKKR